MPSTLSPEIINGIFMYPLPDRKPVPTPAFAISSRPTFSGNNKNVNREVSLKR
uniref:Uncharacterized protein n=1 Tax=Myoviridae sp. ctrMq22 TaxID=2825181 RepID=A0A8S5NW95_9CAUD|nr:MAG TPA: hypothetical protein [Myoviridae sp. ctrMq22]